MSALFVVKWLIYVQVLLLCMWQTFSEHYRHLARLWSSSRCIASRSRPGLTYLWNTDYLHSSSGNTSFSVLSSDTGALLLLWFHDWTEPIASYCTLSSDNIRQRRYVRACSMGWYLTSPYRDTDRYRVSGVQAQSCD